MGVDAGCGASPHSLERVDMNYRIIGVDDDEKEREHLGLRIRCVAMNSSDTLEFFPFSTAAEAERFIAASAKKGIEPSLIVMDHDLGKGQKYSLGCEALKDWRQPGGVLWGKTIPVIYFSAVADQKSVLEEGMIEGGAVSYLPKRISSKALESAIKNNLGLRPVATSELKTGRIGLNRNARIASVDGKVVPLTRKEYALLEMFLQSPGRALPNAFIEASIWDPAKNISRATISMTINRLRIKLGIARHQIETVAGFGYRLNE